MRQLGDMLRCPPRRAFRRAIRQQEVTVGLLHIIWMIIVGFIVGVIARYVYPGGIAMGF